jgi:hypothetical protein
MLDANITFSGRKKSIFRSFRMENQTKKLRLDEIEVDSFVIDNSFSERTILGGATNDVPGCIGPDAPSRAATACVCITPKCIWY